MLDITATLVSMSYADERRMLDITATLVSKSYAAERRMLGAEHVGVNAT